MTNKASETLRTPPVLHFLDPLLFWVLMWLGVDIVVFAAIDEVSLPFNQSQDAFQADSKLDCERKFFGVFHFSSR